MKRPLRFIQPATPEMVQNAMMGVEALKMAVKCLRAAKAMKAVEKARLALKSAEGAERHAQHRLSRTRERLAKRAVDRAGAKD